MLVITVLDFDSGKTRKWHGEKYDILQWLHSRFPEYAEYDSVDDIVEAMNEDGFYQVEVQPVGKDSNLLPVDFLTHESDDPWPRESDAPAHDDSDE